MKLIVIKVNPDIINGGVNSIIVGIFDNDGGQPTMQFNIPKYNIVRDHKEIKVGQELKLIPTENGK